MFNFSCDPGILGNSNNNNSNMSGSKNLLFKVLRFLSILNIEYFNGLL